MIKYIVVFCVLGIAFTSCDNKKNYAKGLPEKKPIIVEASDLNSNSFSVNYQRLDSVLADVKNENDIINFLENNKDLVGVYFEVPNAWDEKPFVNQLAQMYLNPEFKKFSQQNLNFWGDMQNEKNDLNKLFSYIKYYYPDFYVPKIDFIITGFRFDSDIHFSDSLITISNDYFIGDSAMFRPNFYQYMLDRYKKPYLVPMVAMGVSTKFNSHNLNDKNMLAEMIYYGKAHYFIERMIPELEDSLNIQFTGKELEDVSMNADVIWAHFIEKRLLYETKPQEIQRYCGESPKVATIGDNCPGRIGRWLGWQIVRKYMQENPNVTINQLMQNSDAQEIFNKSKFRIETK